MVIIARSPLSAPRPRSLAVIVTARDDRGTDKRFLACSALPSSSRSHRVLARSPSSSPLVMTGGQTNCSSLRGGGRDALLRRGSAPPHVLFTRAAETGHATTASACKAHAVLLLFKETYIHFYLYTYRYIFLYVNRVMA